MDDVDEATTMAGIEYHGVAGASEDCEAAVLRLLTAGPMFARAILLSADREHALILYTDVGDPIAIKSGFASGYGGAGPTALSRVLQFLLSHGVEVEEAVVGPDIIERLDQSALTSADVTEIETGPRAKPRRWTDYIQDREHESALNGTLWRTVPPVLPYTILDPRLMDLALVFGADPDRCPTRAYRRLEDLVRARTGLKESGAKLFSKAFNGDAAPLTWPVEEQTESLGRAHLFTGVFMAYRNPRAHRETTGSDHLSEFLLLNQLFKLEADAVASSAPAPARDSSG